jgi:hypothetical protein
MFASAGETDDAICCGQTPSNAELPPPAAPGVLRLTLGVLAPPDGTIGVHGSPTTRERICEAKFYGPCLAIRRLAFDWMSVKREVLIVWR